MHRGRKCLARSCRKLSGEYLKIRRGFSLRLSAEAMGKLTYADDEVREGMDEIAKRGLDR